MTNLPAADNSAYEDRLAANVRTARERLSLSLDDLARAAGWDIATLTSLEDSGPLPSSSIYDLCGPLHLDVRDLIGSDPSPADAAVTALGSVPLTWWMNPNVSAAVRALADWYNFDATLTLFATPSTRAPATSVAGIGVPEAAQPALPRVEMPRPDVSFAPPPGTPGDAAGDGGEGFEREGARGARIAAALRDGAGLPAGEPVTVEQLADAYGVPWGRRPMPDQVRAVAGHADRRPLLVMNSDRATGVAQETGMHLLVHLLCGEVTLVAVDTLPDQRSDRVHSCRGVGVNACIRAGHVAVRLLLGDDVVDAGNNEQKERESVRGAAAGPASTLTTPAPPQVSGDTAGRPCWFEFDVEVYNRRLEEIVELPHPDLRRRGDGDTVMPAALAWRHLRVVAAGRRGLDRVDELGLHLPAGTRHPTGRDVVEADRLYRHVEAQLSAWNAHAVEELLAP